MKKFLFLAMSAVLFFSCSDDEDFLGDIQNHIIGKWIISESVDTYEWVEGDIGSGEETGSYTYSTVVVIEFEANGNVTQSYEYNCISGKCPEFNSESIEGTYTINQNKKYFTISFRNGMYNKIVKLDSKVLWYDIYEDQALTQCITSRPYEWKKAE